MRYLLSYVHIENGMCEIGKIFGMDIKEMIKCFGNMENACGGCRAQPRLPPTKNYNIFVKAKCLISNLPFCLCLSVMLCLNI